MAQPLHDLALLQQLTLADQWDFLNERDGRQWPGHAWKTLEKLDWGDDELKELLCSLTTDDWQKTVPSCAVHNLPGIEYVDADQYEIHWDEEDHCRRARPNKDCISFSLKLALVCDENGEFAGLVTLHFSGMK